MGEYNYMFTGDTLFISAEGKTWLLGASDAKKRSKVLALIKEDRPWNEIKNELETDLASKMKKWCEEASVEGSGITFNDATILIDGSPIYGSLCSQIRLMHQEGLSLEPMVNFVRKMRKNPSYNIREQLWAFMEACQADGGFTIAEDGDIMAYKVVTSDFKDKHSGTFDNSIGAIVEMPRCDVDDNPNNTCSSGLHFCAYSYVKCFSDIGDRLVLVKINPADVVSIPADYGNAKARCCRYQVVREIDAPVGRSVWKDDSSNEETASEEEANYEDNLGSKVLAYIDDYDFPDGSNTKKVIGRIVAVDPNDEDQPYKLRFFDGVSVVEWWISADDVKTFISGCPNETSSFKSGDFCSIYDICRGKVIDYNSDDNAYLVEYRDEEGVVQIKWFLAFDLEHMKEESFDEDEDEESDEETYLKLKARLKELESILSKRTSEKQIAGLNSESFVKNWFATSSKKMVLAFLESQYDAIMDARMRIEFLEEIPLDFIIERLMEWYDSEYDGNLSINRIWDKIKTAIEVWLTKK